MQTKHILPKWKQSLLSKDQAHRACLMFRSYFFFFCCELLSKPRIHESKKEPWFTSRALGEYRWQKDLKFWSSCFRSMPSEINYFHSTAARELLHWSCSFWAGEGCATRASHQANADSSAVAFLAGAGPSSCQTAVCPLLLITCLENEKIIKSLQFNRALFEKQGEGLDGKEDSWWKSPGDCMFHLTADLPHKSQRFRAVLSEFSVSKFQNSV